MVCIFCRLARQGGYASDAGGWHSAGVKQRGSSTHMERKPPQPPRIPRRQQVPIKSNFVNDVLFFFYFLSHNMLRAQP